MSTTTRASAVVVVPCFNEERRFDRAAFERYLRTGIARILFVDDGSRDGTRQVITAVAESVAGRAEVLALGQNVGKGEAVRAGLRRALDQPIDWVGYLDADLAVAPDELDRLLAAHADALVVLGSRRVSGDTRVQRSRARELCGTAFSAVGSAVLGVRIRDTQCGAKLFRATPALRAALSEPFSSRWAFDIELIGRLLAGTDRCPPISPGEIREAPLLSWSERARGRLGVRGMLRTCLELPSIAVDLARRRADARA